MFFDCWLTSDFLDTTLQRSFQLALLLFVLEQFLTCLPLLILQYLYIHISYVQMTFQDSVLKLNRNKAVSWILHQLKHLYSHLEHDFENLCTIKGTGQKQRLDKLAQGWMPWPKGAGSNSNQKGLVEVWWEIWIDLEAGFIQSFQVCLLRTGPCPQFTRYVYTLDWLSLAAYLRSVWIWWNRIRS